MHVYVVSLTLVLCVKQHTCKTPVKAESPSLENPGLLALNSSLWDKLQHHVVHLIVGLFIHLTMCKDGHKMGYASRHIIHF